MHRPGASLTGSAGRTELILIVVLLVIGFAGQGRPLFDPDEGRYTAVAVEMLEGGDWLTPRLRPDLPHLSKPPLTYWTIAASMGLFGRTELAVRLPTTLAFLATIAAVAMLARRLLPDRARFAALIYATMLFPWAASRVVTADTLLTTFETFAMLGFLFWFTGSSRPGLWLLWISLGLAVLTKGPPGLIPLLPILLFLLIHDRRGLLRLFSPLPVISFLIVGTSWYLAQIAMRPDALDYWIGREVLERMTSSVHERHGGILGGFVVYVPVALAGTLPWILLLPWKTVRGPASLTGDRRLLLLFWIGMPLLLFLAIPSRLPLYVLPLAVPTALWIASALRPEALQKRWAIATLGLWILLLVALASFADRLRPDRNGRALARAITESVETLPDEIVFVNENPSWSLRFYLSRPLQRVNLFGYSDWGDLGYRPLSTTIEDLWEKDRKRLYLLPHHHYIAFRNEMRANGRNPIRAGRFDRLLLFEDRALDVPP